jgi:hypothetical protein
MLYLITPTVLLWNDLPGNLVLTAARDHQVDLAELDWDPSDHPIDPIIVRLALRQGVACSRGLVVRGSDLSVRFRPQELIDVKLEGDATRAKLADWKSGQDDFMEQLIPGWTEHGRQLDASIADGLQSVFRDSVRDLQKELEAAPSEDLLAHWVGIGGALPDPV